MRMINAAVAAEIRQSKLGTLAGCGEVALVIATGRAKCRLCGQRIAKGTEALETVYDFSGSGLAGDPWTGTEIRIHREDCPAPLLGPQQRRHEQ